MLAAGDANGNVYIWKTATGRLLQTLHDPQGLQVSDVSFSPDGTAVAVAANNPAHTDSAIRVWNLATQQVHTFHDPDTAGARHLTFSPDGSLLAVGDANGNTYLWDMLWLNS
jgi:WD40 repeat protein